ncbi:histidine kinase [Bradyrhizobium valentinum]|uniref:histidine kinase n=2 Tax=Bradyrhizobium valentinum TaxID=1518501 RepID=A0A0R3KKW1_9BRAD|nr:histidine kinase [Bradyrhizobium valentinum]KRQ93876.1 histidine kinase [Bradyrhizobium valentinum]
MIVRISALLISVALVVAPLQVAAQEARSRSILVLNQSDLRGPFYYLVFSGLRSVLSADDRSHLTLYAENLDLSRFRGKNYEALLHRYLKEKYQNAQIDVVVAVGAATLDLVLHWRSDLWPEVPVVFAMIDEIDLVRMQLPDGVTGKVVKLPLADSIKAAHALVPDLETVVFVGDAWDSLTIYRNWKEEIPVATRGLKVIDLVGQTMAEVRRRVAELPDRSAIIYSAMFSDGKGTYYPPATAVGLVAEKANRPIVVAAETFLAPGGAGGFLLVPVRIGEEAARLALRILDGELPSNIAPAVGDAVKPIFNWLQMQRWGVREADLPPGSEIRFREPGLWEKYRWQTFSVAAVLLIQAGLISILLHERHRRANAERESRNRLTELAHAHRQATAGELSSTIAHELNQPLGAILTNTETAELILNSPSPNLSEVKEILADIRRDDIRASEVIHRMRSLLRRVPFEDKVIDLNDTVRKVFEFLSVQASARNIALYFEPSGKPLQVKGDQIQLQQVIMNLIVNSMDAMAAMPNGRAVIGRTEVNGGSSAVVSILDSGPGIPADKLNEVFDPFFSTKKQGMGIGLSISRTIVQAHKGRIWAENQSEGGAVFRLSLPLTLS